MTDLPQIIADIRKAMEGATRGPWQVIERRHPWHLPERPIIGIPEFEGRTYPERSGEHIERGIFTVWNDPQSKTPYPIVTLSVGIGVKPGEPAGYLKPRDEWAYPPFFIYADELNEAWQRQVFTVPVYASPAVVPRGKQLDWEKLYPDHTMFPHAFVGSGILGVMYQVVRHFPDRDFYFQGRGFKSLDDAKAAAQADYERRILSALDLPVPAVVPEGWRPIDTAPRDGTRFLAAEKDVDGGWIIGTCVWCKTPHVPLYGFHFTEGDPENWDISNVTRWMPLPPAPEAKEGE